MVSEPGLTYPASPPCTGAQSHTLPQTGQEPLLLPHTHCYLLLEQILQLSLCPIQTDSTGRGPMINASAPSPQPQGAHPVMPLPCKAPHCSFLPGCPPQTRARLGLTLIPDQDPSLPTQNPACPHRAHIDPSSQFSVNLDWRPAHLQSGL